MALKKATKKSPINSITTIGIKSPADSIRENNADELSRIAERAYYKAELRGYEPGHEIQDWLEAEAEIVQKSPL